MELVFKVFCIIQENNKDFDYILITIGVIISRVR